MWRGGVNPWQCDQMGHLNVRFYVAHAIEALAALAAALGMNQASSPRATSTLIVREHHIRFLKEAQSGDPLHMTAGLLDIDATGATVLQTLFHSLTGEPAAVIQTRLVHARAQDGQPFPWPRAALARAGALSIAIPPGLEARSLTPGDPPEAGTSAQADRLGLVRNGLGAFALQECDAFGRVGAAQVIGRMGDGAAHIIATTRDSIGAPASGDRPVGVAVVEYRLLYRTWPGPGDRYDMRSGFKSVEPRRLRLSHWLLDPESGQPWAEAHAVLVPFDLKRRKAVTLPQHALEALASRVVAFEG